MDKQKIETKLKTLSHKNKKLLESISTHLINNPDEIEGKLHQHRFLEQKYNELIGFSRENVERYEKIQAMLLVKEQQIKKLNKMLSEAREQNGYKIDNMDRDYRKKKAKDEEELQSSRQQISQLKKTIVENKQKFSEQKKKLQEQIQGMKKMLSQKTSEAEKNAGKVKQIQAYYEQKIREYEKQSLEQKQKVKSLEQENAKLIKNNKIEELNSIRGKIYEFRDKNI